MSTPLSNLTSYCTPAQAVPFIDQRLVGELINDLDVRIAPAALLTNADWISLLQAASGEVESACMVAGRYNPSDLAGLTGNSAVFLQKLVARLAYGELFARRYPDREMPAQVEQAWKLLEKLREGQMIFGLVETQAAGQLSAPQFVSVGDVQLLSLTSYMAGRYFGLRGNLERIGIAQGGASWPPNQE